MLEVGRRLDLGEEPLGSDHRSEFGLQNLQRDLPLVLQVVGQVDRGHTTLTEFSLDVVAAFQGCVQAGYRVHAAKMRGLDPFSHAATSSTHNTEPIVTGDTR